jgi:hypothetical protein
MACWRSVGLLAIGDGLLAIGGAVGDR